MTKTFEFEQEEILALMTALRVKDGEIGLTDVDYNLLNVLDDAYEEMKKEKLKNIIQKLYLHDTYSPFQDV